MRLDDNEAPPPICLLLILPQTHRCLGKTGREKPCSSFRFFLGVVIAVFRSSQRYNSGEGEADCFHGGKSLFRCTVPQEKAKANGRRRLSLRGRRSSIAKRRKRRGEGRGRLNDIRVRSRLPNPSGGRGGVGVSSSPSYNAPSAVRKNPRKRPPFYSTEEFSALSPQCVVASVPRKQVFSQASLALPGSHSQRYLNCSCRSTRKGATGQVFLA